jgi:hypothetical protein
VELGLNYKTDNGDFYKFKRIDLILNVPNFKDTIISEVFNKVLL